jgi:hypothetical protein
MSAFCKREPAACAVVADAPIHSYDVFLIEPWIPAWELAGRLARKRFGLIE